MKKLLVILLLFVIPVVHAQVIQEVLYDPVSESGGEAVLIYNPTDSVVDISGWTLQTEAAVTDAKIPVNTSLEPHGSYLIADVGWETTKDADLLSADHEEAITLANTDAGVALKDATGTIIDAIGWGVASGISTGLFEGTPHGLTIEGMSLRRTQDTDDNALDFIESEPSFVVVDGTEIPVELEVGESDRLTITEFTLSPLINLSASLSIKTNQHATVHVLAFNTTFTLDTSDGIAHDGILTMPSSQPPGALLVTVVATNGTMEIIQNQTLIVPKVVSVGLDMTALSFSKLLPGTTSALEGDDDLTTLDKPTLRNNGNVPIDIVLSAIAPTKETKAFSLSKINFTLTNVTKTLKTSTQTVKTRLLPGETLPLSFTITVPEVAAGKYVGSITIGAKETK